MSIRALFAASMCVALAARTAAKDDACRVDSKQTRVKNGDFEQDSISGKYAPSYQYRNGDFPDVSEWEIYDHDTTDRYVGSPVLGKSGNAAWGGLKTSDGSQYLILQGRGTSARQTISNLDAKKHYMLTWLGAERPFNHENDELISVKVNSDYVLYRHQPADAFTEYNYQFMPDSTGKAIIAFENESPGLAYTQTLGKVSGGLSVFIAKVQVHEVIDCGSGATCHARPTPRTGYKCACDEPGFVGASVTDGKANCTTVADAGADVKQLATQLTAFKGTVDDLEASAKTARDDTGALQKTQVSISSRVASLEKTVTELLQANTGLLQTNAEQQTTNTALLASNEQLKKLITRLQQSTVKVVVEDEAQPKAGGQAPEIETDGADVNIKPQAGRRLRVNDEPVLTAGETTRLIKAAVEDALKAIADEL